MKRAGKYGIRDVVGLTLILRTSKREAAFTIVEALVALTVTAVIGAGVLVSLLQANRYAVAARNQTSAKELSEGKLEQLSTVAYAPDSGVTPSLLTTGTTSESVSVYVEQNNSTITVPGSRTTTIATADATLKLLQATVTVSYTYRGKPLSYTVCTLRAPD